MHKDTKISDNQQVNIHESYLSLFENTTINDDSDIKEPVPFVKVNGSTFANLGDISFVSGVPKSGKSTVTGFILATALMKDKSPDFDSLGIVSNYHGNRPIICIDTEQHPAHTKKRLKIALKMAGVQHQNKQLLRVMNWRTFPQKVRYEYLIKALDTFKSACLWIIDGITDFVTSANNEEAGNELLGLLMQKASENNACFILLIHENAGNGKLRGHIGSEAERKCSGTISIKKDREKQVHFIEPKYIRDDEEFTPVVFKYDKVLSRMVSVDSETAKATIQEQKEKSKGSETKQLFAKCIGTDKILARAEFRKRIEREIDPHNTKAKGTREKAANDKIEGMVKSFLISVKGTGKSQTVEPLTIIDEPVPYQTSIFIE